MNIAIRIFGLLGLASGVISFQFKKHRQIMAGKLLSEVAFGVQYFLLDAPTGGIVSVVSVVRNYLFARFVEKEKSTTPLIIIFSCVIVAASLCIGIAEGEGMILLLPMVSKVLSCISYGMKNTRLLRLISLPTCFLWLCYNSIVGAWESMTGDLLSIGSLLIAVYKYDIKGQEEKKA